MWTALERRAARGLSVLVLAHAAVVLVLALQVVGRSGHTNVVPVAPGKHSEPESIDPDDGEAIVRFALTWRTLACFVGTVAVAALAGSAGIGGGALYVPLFYVAGGFPLKAATGLSQAAICGGGAVTALFNLAARHPWDPAKPLVDLDLALVLTPALLLGVSVGVLLNELMPAWGVLLLLVCLLGHVCRAVAARGRNEWAEERQRAAAAEAAAAIRAGPAPRLAPISVVAPAAAAAALPLPARLQIVISREASRAQIAPDSSEDEDGGGGAAAAGRAGGGGGGGGGGSGSARAAGSGGSTGRRAHRGGVPGSSGSVSAASPLPRLQAAAAALREQQQQEQEQQQHMAAGAPLGALATVPSGDSEAMEEGVRRNSKGGRSSGSSGSISSGSEEGGTSPRRRPKGAFDAFDEALETERRLSASSPEVPQLTLAPPLPPQQQQPRSASLTPGPRMTWAPDVYGGSDDDRHGGAGGDAPASAGAASLPPPPAGAFPWVKLASLALLWSGFLGLSAIDALLPLCSVRYIAYVALFLAATLGVTAMFIRAIFLEPSSAPTTPRSGRPRKPWLEHEAALAAAAAVAAAAGGDSAGGDLLAPLIEAPGSSGGGGSANGNGISGGSGGGGGSGGTAGAGAAASASGFGSARSAPPGSDADAGPAASLAVVAALNAAVAGAAGLLTGTAGLAGGGMLGAALLDFRVHPQVASATASLLVLASSGAATLSYAEERRLAARYAAAFAACAAAGSAAGALLVAGAVRRSGRASVAVLGVAAALALGTLLTAALGAWDVKNELQRRSTAGGFAPICR